MNPIQLSQLTSINNKKNFQKHTKARRRGVIGHDMALGTTWPQHNTTNNPQNDHPEKRKI